MVDLIIHCRGASGLTMGANLSYLEYDVIPDEFKSTDPNGYSTILGLTANYPWIRSQDLNLNAFAEFDNRSFKNKTTPVHRVTMMFKP